MKLHLCCGDVYLAGYCNCDVDGILIGEGETVTNPTDLEHYYHDRQLGHRQTPVLDRRMDVTERPWDFEDASIDEIVMVNGIEHFTQYEACCIVAEVRRVLKRGGRFLVDFPDLERTVEQFAGDDPEFCMRHIYGNHRDAYSVHHWGYTKATIRELLGAGWRIRFRPIVQHDYPVTGCEATKVSGSTD